MKLRTRFGGTIALLLGVVVIIGSIVGGVALASRGHASSSTPAVMVGNEDNQTPTAGATGGRDEGTQTTEDKDGEHHASASPDSSCEADDAMESAEPEAELSAEPSMEPSAEPSPDEATEDHCMSSSMPTHHDD